uniref:Uncharacterized protein n=1 Tax=Setaria viridis TaxID=4556 RepID=A0A4U6WN72_SETVI|nr:hypothetical protein SEVIR_1G220801v2 [Setaria viridis]
MLASPAGSTPAVWWPRPLVHAAPVAPRPVEFVRRRGRMPTAALCLAPPPAATPPPRDGASSPPAPAAMLVSAHDRRPCPLYLGPIRRCRLHLLAIHALASPPHRRHPADLHRRGGLGTGRASAKKTATGAARLHPAARRRRPSSVPPARGGTAAAVLHPPSPEAACIGSCEAGLRLPPARHGKVESAFVGPAGVDLRASESRYV